jgi:hypothetical protein
MWFIENNSSHLVQIPWYVPYCSPRPLLFTLLFKRDDRDPGYVGEALVEIQAAFLRASGAVSSATEPSRQAHLAYPKQKPLADK